MESASKKCSGRWWVVWPERNGWTALAHGATLVCSFVFNVAEPYLVAYSIGDPSEQAVVKIKQDELLEIKWSSESGQSLVQLQTKPGLFSVRLATEMDAQRFLEMVDQILKSRLMTVAQEAHLLAEQLANKLEGLVQVQILTPQNLPVQDQLETSHGTITAQPVKSWANVLLLLRTLNCDFVELYPQTLLSKAGMRTLWLTGPLAFAEQTRKAIPDLEHRALYINVEAGSFDRLYGRRVVHHEMFHFIEYFCYVDAYGIIDDTTWSSLNSVGFSYRAKSGAEVQSEHVIERAQRCKHELYDGQVPSGFLNSYCTAAVEEDRAELYAYMATSTLDLVNWCKQDSILQLKLRQMMQFLGRVLGTEFIGFWQYLIRAPSANPVETPIQTVKDESSNAQLHLTCPACLQPLDADILNAQRHLRSCLGSETLASLTAW